MCWERSAFGQHSAITALSGPVPQNVEALLEGRAFEGKYRGTSTRCSSTARATALGRLEPLTRVERDRWSRRTTNGFTGWIALLRLDPSGWQGCAENGPPGPSTPRRQLKLSRRQADDRLLRLQFAIIIAPGNLRPWSRRKLSAGVWAAFGPDANGLYPAQDLTSGKGKWTMKAGVVYPQVELGGDTGAVKAFPRRPRTWVTTIL